MENRLPELRFPEFSGEWNKVLLDDFAKRGSGHTPSKSHPEYYNGEINWISLSDSKKLDNGFIEETNTKITPLGIKNSSAVLHEAGSVLLSRDAGVGKSAVMKHSMAVSQHFIVWTAKSGISSNWFLYNILQILKPEFERIAIGNTIKTIGLPYFKKLQITVPSFPEQDKIANFLTEVDKKLTALKQKKSLLEQYKKGVMQQIFSQKLRFKDDNGNDFPDWEEKKLGEVCEFSNGKAHENEIEEEGKYIVVNSKFISRNGTVKKYSNNQILPLFKNDIVMVMSDVPNGKALAKCFLIDEDNRYTLNQRICQLKSKNNFTPFLINLINRNKYYLSFDSGVGQTNLKKEDVLNCPLYFPVSIQEQIKIANFLSAIDEKIKHCQRQMEKTEVWKKGLLQQLFL